MDCCGSVTNILLWCWGNRKKVKNRYSDFVMSLAWFVWVVDENVITLRGWWMCGWPVAMHRAWLHWSLHCWIDGLPGSCCERSVLTNGAKRQELLNINPLICFQGAGSWGGQWTERLHVDLRHRLPPGGSRSLPLPLQSWRVGLAGRQAGRSQSDRREESAEERKWPQEGWFDVVTIVVRGPSTDFHNLKALLLQQACQDAHFDPFCPMIFIRISLLLEP